jgi:alpha-1,6-mannosyltransferase
MMKRHIIDTTLFFAPRCGGVRRYLLAKRRYLANRADVRHTIVVPGPVDALFEPGVVTVRSPGIPFGRGYRVPIGMKRWRDTLVRLHPDIIEAGDPYHVSWAALAAAECAAVPSVAFVHSDLSMVLANRCGGLIGRSAEVYLRSLYGRFDLVMAPSAVTAARLREAGVKRVVVQPLGVDENIFHPARRNPRLREHLGLAPETRLLIFAGRMSREKRIPVLCRAVEEMGAPYHLLLVGGAVNRRVSRRVTMLAFEHDSTRLASLIASADALVHAGGTETFGLVVVEAMACGRPVVGVRGGAVPELVTADVGVLADPGGAQSLKEAIAALYSSNIESMGVNARAKVERHYTWHNTVDQQLQCYARLAHSARVAGRPAYETADTP